MAHRTRIAMAAAAALAALGCSPTHVGDLNPDRLGGVPATPDPAGLACRLLKASRCAYADVEVKGPLAPDFCPDLPGLREGTWGVGKHTHEGYRDAAFVARYPDAVIVAFRGTLPPTTPDAANLAYRDWKNDANSNKVYLSRADRTEVHQGFKESLDSVWDEIGPTLQTWQGQGALAGVPLYVTGHSKGGAVALIGALRLRDEGYAVTAVYTFAAARAGGAEFRKRYDSLGIPTRRFENQGDIVPHLPFGPQEDDAVGLLSSPYLKQFRAGLLFYPVGPLTYLFEDGRVLSPSGRAELDLNADRIAEFKRRLDGYQGTEAGFIADLGSAHSIDPAKAGESTAVHRYSRAVCGTEP